MSTELLACGSVVVLAAGALSGLTGLGFGVVALPSLLLLGADISWLVPDVLVMAVVGRIPFLVVQHRQVASADVLAILGSSALGVVIGLIVRTVASDAQLALLAAALAGGSAAAMYAPMGRASGRQPPHSSPRYRMLAGSASGFMAVTSSLSGVTVASLLSRQIHDRVRRIATLSAYLVAVNTVSIVLLLTTSRVPSGPALRSISVWIWFCLGGNVLGAALGRRVSSSAARHLTAAVAVLGAVGVLLGGTG